MNYPPSDALTLLVRGTVLWSRRLREGGKVFFGVCVWKRPPGLVVCPLEKSKCFFFLIMKTEKKRERDTSLRTSPGRR